MNKNKHNREHANQNGNSDFAIEKLLPIGKENAMPATELIKIVGCTSVRDLQARIAIERKQGAVICSGTGKGYWRPKNQDEIREFCSVMDARARNIFAATRSAKRVLEIPEGQQLMEVNKNGE